MNTVTVTDNKNVSRFHTLHHLLGVNNRISSRFVHLAAHTMKGAGASKEMLMLLGALEWAYPYAALQNKYNAKTNAMFTAEEAVDMVAGLHVELEELRWTGDNDKCPYFSSAFAVVEYARQLISTSAETKQEEITFGLHFCDKALSRVGGWLHYNA